MNIWIGLAGFVGATLVGVGIADRSHVTAYLRGWVGRHIVADDPYQSFDAHVSDVPGLVDARRRHPSQRGQLVPAVWVSVCPSCGRPVRRGPLDEHVCQRRGVQS